jgi:hypothetical protein
MSERAADIEMLLRQAFQPIEPPAELEARLEARLSSLVEAAADELEAWELSAMRDPRNWIRPVAAVGVGGAAAVGLVLVRTQRKRHRRREASDTTFELVQNTLRDLGHEAGKLIDEAQRRLGD